jgi:myo-inositol-1(or 4)-monophosphatase
MTVLFSSPVDPGLLSRALEVSGRLANDAAEVIAATADRSGRFDRGPRTHPFDWVTDTGRTLERHTRRVLAAEFPEVPVIGADYATVPPGRKYWWLVAPLDGTANYLAGLPWFGYALALLDSSGPVVGVISDPTRAEIYAAARGRGTRVNGVPVHISDQATLRGHPVCLEPGTKPWPAQLTLRAAQASREVRVLGSAALAVTQVVLGHAVAAVLEDYRQWDVAAGVALALEAGAVVLDRDGKADPLPSGGLLVAAPSAAEEVLGWWRDD